MNFDIQGIQIHVFARQLDNFSVNIDCRKFTIGQQMPQNSKKKALSKPQQIRAAVTAYMARRPHRSFKISNARDYRRSLKLPGYIAFTQTVNKALWKYRKTFISLALIYAALTIVLIGIGSQASYSSLSSTLQDTGTELFQGNFNEFGKAVILFASIGTSGLNGEATEAQQIYVVVLALLVWLTTVWLLRNLLAGHKVKLRDGLYNAGSPIVATALVVGVFVLQLIPLGLAILGYSAADSTGLLITGVEAMLFWFAAIFLTVVSLYWVTSTFFALIIVTLPGMYPWKALRAAGDMLVGRRLRVLLRILWMFGAIIVAGAVVLIPVILITSGLTKVWPVVDSVPIVPATLMLFSVAAFVWGAAYIYMLYRKVVDDDAKPVQR